MVLIPYGADVAREAKRFGKLAFYNPEPVMIRSLDLIDVASASIINATTLAATDKRLRDLAALLTISLFPTVHGKPLADSV